MRRIQAVWKRISATVVFLAPVLIATAQFNPNNSFLDAHFGKPVTFSSRDSSFSLAIGGRIQSLAEARYDRLEKEGLIDASIRRVRLNLGGNAINEKFTYRIQLSFSQRDISADNPDVQNNLVLRDAMLFFSPNKNLRFGFGQTKLPGNRQRQTSSANLQFADRSNTNALFTLDRDKGIWIVYTFDIDKIIVSNTVAITSGEGRIISDKSAGLCYSFRSEILPFGEFKNNGDYIESDLFFEDRFRLSLAASYSFNDDTRRVAGQLGQYLYNGEHTDLKYYGFDIAAKFRGWSFTGEIFRRSATNAISIDTANPSKTSYVYTGTGLLVQTGYLFTDKDEIALRYGRTSPSSGIEHLVSTVNEYMIGYSHYFFRHNLKVQTDAGYFRGPGTKILQARGTAVFTF